MPDRTLDLSNVISVVVQGAPSQLGSPQINSIGLISSETPIAGDFALGYKVYVDPDSVITDWGSDSKAAAIAEAVFAQSPNPLLTGGYLVIIPRQMGESVKAAIIRVNDAIYFFGVLVDTEYHADQATFLTLADHVQSIDKMLFYGSSDASDFAPGGLLDLVRTGTRTHTRALFHSVTPREFAAAYASRLLSTDFSGSNTTGTMHLKALAGIDVDVVATDQTNLTTMQAAGVDCYVSIAGVPGVFTSGQNQFSDEVYNEFWFKFALEVAGFNYLRSANGKIPQTETAIEGLKNEYRKVCEQGIVNGFLAPGAWNSSTTFGDGVALRRSVADVGYYVWSLPVSKQSQSDREARKAPLAQIAAKAAGAVHKANVLVNINL